MKPSGVDVGTAEWGAVARNQLCSPVCLRQSVTVSGCAILHKQGGRPRAISSASAVTITPIWARVCAKAPAWCGESNKLSPLRARCSKGNGSCGNTSVATRIWPVAATSSMASKSTTAAPLTSTSAPPPPTPQKTSPLHNPSSPPPPPPATPPPPPRRHRQKSLPVQQALVLRGHPGDHEYDLRAGQHLLQRSRLTTHGLDVLRGQPRVIGFDRRVKWREQGHDGAPEIAKTDETQVLTMQGIGVAVCVETVFFAPLTEIPVGTTDATRQVERHAECRFCHRLGKYGTGAENPDATRDGNAIVDIRQEVAFHIEYRPQMRRQAQTRCRHIDLANEDFQTRGQRFELGPGGRRSVMNMQIPQCAQALQLGCREDVCNPARRRSEEDDFGRRCHGRSPFLSCLFEKK